MNMHQPYGKTFAKAWALMWTDFADRVAPPAVEYYKGTELGKAGTPVLDLCCGAGTLAMHFLEAGFEITGIDLSEHMLAHARHKARDYIESGKAELIQADVTEFELPGRFGLVTSIFDSLNHLNDLADLSRCFERVYEHLEPGGSFIFDLNTRLGLRHWDEIKIYDDEYAMIVKRGGFDSRNEQAFYRVTGFIVRDEDGLYERFDETVVEKVFAMEDVKRALLKTGFGSVKMTDWLALDQELEDPESETRVTFLAVK